MKLSEIIDKLGLNKIVDFNGDIEITDAYASDLLSDVMGNAKSGQIWITMQTHKNVAAIASLKDMPAILIIGNGNPDKEMIEHARNEEICVLVSPEPSFHVCGKLYHLITGEN
ncbi:MAG: serine kinase [Bacteroidales bacterium]|jgi:predicted transcriptional regulator|nr:serine kinase [Bacteroidales bacterium]